MLGVSDKYFVVDTNYLRDPRLESFLSNSQNESFVLTEVVILETYKSPDWNYIYKKSFQILNKYLEKVYATLPFGNILAYERRNKNVCTNLISEYSTLQIRKILMQLKEGNTVYIENELLGGIKSAQEHMSIILLDHSKNKFNWLSIHKRNLESYSPSLRKDLIKNRLKDNQLYDLTIQTVEEIFNGDRKIFGNEFDYREIQLLKNMNSNHYKLFATLVFNSFLWQIKQGLENMNGGKITNEKHDIENIIIALSGKGILSNEKYVNNLYNHIRNILEIKFGGNDNRQIN